MDLAVDLAGMTRSINPPVARKTIVTMAGDHGVAAEDTSTWPAAYVGDTHVPDAIRTRTLGEETHRVFRSRVVNPRWIAAMKRRVGSKLTETYGPKMKSPWPRVISPTRVIWLSATPSPFTSMEMMV